MFFDKDVGMNRNFYFYSMELSVRYRNLFYLKNQNDNA